MIPYRGHTLRQSDAGEAGAIRKRIMPYRGHTLRQSDAGEVVALIKRIVPYRGQSCGQSDAGEAGAIIKRTLSYRGDGSVKEKEASFAELYLGATEGIRIKVRYISRIENSKANFGIVIGRGVGEGADMVAGEGFEPTTSGL